MMPQLPTSNRFISQGGPATFGSFQIRERHDQVRQPKYINLELGETEE